MRVKSARGGSDAGGCEPPASSDGRGGAIARRSAMLLGGTAALALSIAQPAGAISINDQVAAAAGGVANHYDKDNQFPSVVSLFSASSPGSQCTGSLINSRTILTAAHCFLPNSFGIPSISFNPIAAPGVGITSFVRQPNFQPATADRGPSADYDIAVISLAQPVTNIAPATLMTLQPGQAGFPAKGTTITMVGYGIYGTGSEPPVNWVSKLPAPDDVVVGPLTTGAGSG